MRKYFAFFSFSRACLKKALCKMCITICGRFLSASSISFSPSWKSEPGTFPFFLQPLSVSYPENTEIQSVFSPLLPIFPEFPPEKSGSKAFHGDRSKGGKRGSLDTSHSADPGTEAASSVYAIYHRGNLLHTASGGRVHNDL